MIEFSALVINFRRNRIEEAKCVICIGPGNYKIIYEKIDYILDNKKIKLLGSNGRKYLEENLAKEVSIAKYKETIVSI